MKIKYLLFILLVLSVPLQAHEGHNEHEESVSSSPLDLIQIGMIIFGIIAIVLLILYFYKPDFRKSILVLLVVVALIVSFTTFFKGPKDKKPIKTVGPGKDPMHMEGFYRDFDADKAKKVDDIVRDPANLPEAIDRNHSKTVNITLVAKERISQVRNGTTYHYWTYNGTVPGPILRVREGDTVRLTLKNENSSTHSHSIDLHAVTGPGGGAGIMGEVDPGEENTIEFKALKDGFYVYHCANPNIPTHISNQMFGGIIVEPKKGMEKVDKEFAVFQGELYTKGVLGEKGFQPFDPKKMLDEEPVYYTFNGKPHGITGNHKLKAKTGDEIRLFFGNMGNSKVSSFHIIGEMLGEVYKGNYKDPIEDMETVVVGDGQAITAEFKTEVPGDYVLVDHSLARLDKGAWGILSVEGDKNKSKSIYSSG